MGEVAARLDVRPYATEDTTLWVVSDLTPGLDGLPQQIGADHVLGISPASTSLARSPCALPSRAASTSAPAVACRRCTSPRTAATWSRPTSTSGPRHRPVQRRPQRGRRPGRGARGILLRAGARRAVRPDRHEPAVRHLARDRGAAGLPRLGAARRPGGRGHRPRRARPPHRARLVPGARELGGRAASPLGRAARLLAGPGRRRARRAARAGRPRGVRRALAQGLRAPPGDRRRPGGVPPSLRHLARLAGGAARRGGRLRLGQPARRRHRPARPLGLAVRRRAADRARDRRLGGIAHHDAGADARLLLREDVRQETVGPAGAEDPEAIVLRQQRGFRRARQADTVVAALVGACDGELAVGPLLDAVAQLLDRDPAETRRRTSRSCASSWTRVSSSAGQRDADAAYGTLRPVGPIHRPCYEWASRYSCVICRTWSGCRPGPRTSRRSRGRGPRDAPRT